MARTFWGRIPVEHTAALFSFDKDSNYKNLIHRIKYHGQKELGYDLGYLFGQELRHSALEDIDLIIPVPG